MVRPNAREARTGRYDPETWNNTEPHEVSLDHVGVTGGVIAICIDLRVELLMTDDQST